MIDLKLEDTQETLNFLQKVRELIKYYLSPITNLLTKKEKKILVLGIKGVGKTQFIYSLSEETKERIAISSRTGGDEYKLFMDEENEENPFVWIDTHGEDRKASVALFREKLDKHEIVGIINVVSYGYMPPRAYADFLKTREDIAKIPQKRQDFLTEEEEALNDWIKYINKDLKWIITLMNKVDFWYPERVIVEEYYENTHKKIIAQEIKDQNLKCANELFKYSSILEPLYTELVSSKEVVEIAPLHAGVSKKKKYEIALKKYILKMLK